MTRRYSLAGVLSVAAVAFVGFAVLISSSAATAHSGDAKYPRKWPSDDTFSIGNLESPFNNFTAKNSIKNSMPAWNGVSGNWLDMTYRTEDSSVDWAGTCASSVPTNELWVISSFIVTGTLGYTNRCGSSGNLYAVMIRISDNASNTWHIGASSSVPSGAYDLRSLMVHEFGHGEGYKKHFKDTIDTECQGSGRQTMCKGLPPGTSYKRTLESHDKHTVKDAY